LVVTSRLVNLAACIPELPRAAQHLKRDELLAAVRQGGLSEDERTACGRALVAWLADTDVDEVTRRRVSAAVLELGYPWALHLEAQFLPKAAARGRRHRAAAGLVVLATVALSTVVIAPLALAPAGARAVDPPRAALTRATDGAAARIVPEASGPRALGRGAPEEPDLHA
jgi:hypothetical protein